MFNRKANAQLSFSERTFWLKYKQTTIQIQTDDLFKCIEAHARIYGGKRRRLTAWNKLSRRQDSQCVVKRYEDGEKQGQELWQKRQDNICIASKMTLHQAILIVFDQHHSEI